MPVTHPLPQRHALRKHVRAHSDTAVHNRRLCFALKGAGRRFQGQAGGGQQGIAGGGSGSCDDSPPWPAATPSPTRCSEHVHTPRAPASRSPGTLLSAEGPWAGKLDQFMSSKPSAAAGTANDRSPAAAKSCSSSARRILMGATQLACLLSHRQHGCARSAGCTGAPPRCGRNTGVPRCATS